jgi:probable O-glycosylation ligase (exosortase A-associated)
MSKGLLFTYLLTYGGAVVSLFSPHVGLLIYVCFAIVRPDFMWHWSVPSGNYSRFVALALLLGWALQSFGKWCQEAGAQGLLESVGTFFAKGLLSGVALLIGWPLKELGRSQLILTLLVWFWLWSALSTLFAANESVARDFVESLGKIVLIFLVGLTTLDSVAKLRQLAWVIVLSQGYVAFELNVSYFSGYNRLVEEGFAAMDNNCNAVAMVTCIGLAFFLGLHSSRWWLKVLSFVLALLMVHAVMFSFSRGGLLALCVSAVVGFVLMSKRPLHYAVMLATVAIGFYLAGPEVRERFVTAFAESPERDASAGSRLLLWSQCWDTMLKNPIVGIGPDHWPLVVHEYGWPRGKEAHTLWLQIGAELGFPGLLLLLGFYVATIVRILRLCRRPDLPDPWLENAARMVVPSLIGFMVAAQFVSLEKLEAPYYVALIAAGALRLASPQPARVEQALATPFRTHEPVLVH